MKLKIVISIVIISALCASCASHRTGYRPPKRKKNDCNCSQWSQNSYPVTQEITTPLFA